MEREHRFTLEEADSDYYGYQFWSRTALTKRDTEPTLVWCRDQFGHEYEASDRWIWDGLDTFRFHKAADATAFRLRWC